jgi:MFS family permease
VPSNIILSRIGAKIWIARIMIVWGLISAGTMFTDSKTTFYVLRFLLGAAEAGFFPGIILYLTYWYPREYRATMVAWFMTAIPLAGVIGGPLSGWILNAMSGVASLKGWQWLYLVEGLLPVVAGVCVLFCLDNGPATAGWLSQDEKDLLLSRIREEELSKQTAGHTAWDAFRSVEVWLLAAVYFCIVIGLYGISFWLPQIIKETLTLDTFRIGLISAVPWGVAAVVMVLYGYHSDKTVERRWHVSLACLTASFAFAVCGFLGVGGWAGFMALVLVTAGIMAALSSFWALPTGILTGTAAAAGIAWINSFGNLAGYVSPKVVGIIRDADHNNMAPALCLMSASMLVAGLLTLYVTRPARTMCRCTGDTLEQ